MGIFHVWGPDLRGFLDLRSGKRLPAGGFDCGCVCKLSNQRLPPFTPNHHHLHLVKDVIYRHSLSLINSSIWCDVIKTPEVLTPFLFSSINDV